MTGISKLHTPISPAASASHSGLCTLVQAVPLAVLVWSLGQSDVVDLLQKAFKSGVWPEATYLLAIKAIFALLAIAFAWHEYCTMTNYVAWHLSSLDTLIWFAAIIPESCLAVSITSDQFKWYALWMSFTALSAAIAYGRVYLKTREDASRDLVRAHFHPDEKLADVVHRVLVSYNRRACGSVLLAFAFYAGLYFFVAYTSLTQSRQIAIGCLLYSIVFFLGFRSGLAALLSGTHADSRARARSD